MNGAKDNLLEDVQDTLQSIHDAVPQLERAVKEARITDAAALVNLVSVLVWKQLKEIENARAL